MRRFVKGISAVKPVAVPTPAGLTRRSAGEKPYRVFRMKNSKVINVQGCTLMTRRPCQMFNSVHPWYAVKRRDLCYAQISLLLVYTAILGWFLLCKNIAGLTRRSAGEKPYRVFRMKNSKVKNWQGCQFLNRIRVATDVVHYRGCLV